MAEYEAVFKVYNEGDEAMHKCYYSFTANNIKSAKKQAELYLGKMKGANVISQSSVLEKLVETKADRNTSKLVKLHSRV